MRPPHVKDSWDKCTPYIQAHVLAFHQTREYEEHELMIAQAKANAKNKI